MTSMLISSCSWLLPGSFGSAISLRYVWNSLDDYEKTRWAALMTAPRASYVILFSWIQQLKQDLASSAVYSIDLTFGNFQNSSVVVLLLHHCRQDPRSIGSDFVDSCLVCACRLASVGCSVGILLRPLRGHLGTLLWLYHKLIRSWSASLE